MKRKIFLWFRNTLFYSVPVEQHLNITGIIVGTLIVLPIDAVVFAFRHNLKGVIFSVCGWLILFFGTMIVCRITHARNIARTANAELHQILLAHRKRTRRLARQSPPDEW